MSDCKPTDEVKRIIRAMAKNRVEAGITDPVALVDAIHEAIYDHTPLWKSEIADIISGYGQKPRQATKSELQTRLEAIKKELRDMARAVDKPSKPKAEKTSRTPEQVRNETRQKQLRQQMADIQRQIDAGDFSRPEPAKFQYNEETNRLEAQRDALRKQADKLERRLAWKNQSTPAKVADTFLALYRAVILSSLHTIGKLSSAAAARTVSTPIEEAIGGMLHLIPGIRGISEKAPREGGGFNTKAEGAAVRATLSKDTLRDIRDTVKTGMGSLDALYGKGEKGGNHPYFDWIGQVHGALKQPAKRNEFFRAFTKRATALHKQLIAEGKSPAEADRQLQDPATIAMLGTKAYADGQRAIFMQDNMLVTAFRMLVNYLKHAGQEGSFGRAASGTAGRVLEYLFPIVKIPTNYVGEATSYLAGAPKAVIQLIAAGGKSKLTADQADFIMRNLKKQTLGMAIVALGYYLADEIGGYYDRHLKRHGADVQPGDIKTPAGTIPKFLNHYQLAEMLHFGATIRRIEESTQRNAQTKKKEPKGLGEGLLGAGKGLVGQVPFFDEPGRLANAAENTKTLGNFLGGEVRGALIPPDVQRLAKMLDDQQALKRRPQGFVDQLKSGIPGLREQVPLQDVKHMSIDERLDAWDKMTPKQRVDTDMQRSIVDSARRRWKDLTPEQRQRVQDIR